MSKIAKGSVLVLCITLVFSHVALAFDPYYNTQNNIIFLDDPNGASCAVTGGSTSFSPTTAKLDSQALQRIKNLQSVYQQASDQTKVPWQVYAAVDYREDNNSPDKSMLDGNPLGTHATDSNNTPTTKLGSILTGSAILAGHAKDNYGVDVTQPMSFDQLQKAFVGYNRGNSYLKAGVSPDLSPYVMNQYDDKHTNMKYPNIPGETLAGDTDSRLGAMAVYANIATLDSGTCVGAGVGAKVDYTGLYPALPAGNIPDNMLCTPRPSQPNFRLLKGPACDSFIALNAAYQQRFGQQMPVSGGYRSAAEQIACGGTKANPGGSNPNCIYYDPKNDPPEHLWGTAIDFSGPLTNKTSVEHKWLVENGTLDGWFWPNWASGGNGGNSHVEEDWHFAYYFVGHNPSTDKLESYK